MDAIHSRSSVFYQAMPAVGADGKNIMKLIPVKRVNGQFYQTETPQSGVSVYNYISPVHTANKSAMTPPNDHQLIRKQVSAANASSNQVHPAHLDSGGPPQQQGVNLTTRVPQTAFPPPGPPHQLPVMVKSAALPRGQLLKIPPNAQVQRVQRVPDSELSPVIKDSRTVVYVSPVDPGAPGPTAPPKRLSNTRAGGSPPTRATPQLKLVPKFSDRPHSPIRWVIDGAEGPPSQNPQTHRPTENALVVFDGRVFFVANKNGSSLKPTAAGQTTVPPSPEPPVPPGSRDRRGPSDQQDVIDLCGDDDDAQKDPPPQAPPSRQDEDNVIFVSYIPPKPDSVRIVPPQVPAQRDEGQQETFICRETDLCGPAGTGGTGRQRSVPDLQLDTQTASPAEPNSREESAQTAQKSELPAPSWTSPAAPEPGQRSDPQLRKQFGITAEVKIYLQQVDGAAAAAGCITAHSKTSEAEDKTPSPQDHCGPHGLPGLSKPNPEPPSALESCHSALRRSSEAQAVIGYMEPIDEDISDESEAQSKPKTKPVPPETQPCVDTGPDTRRVGRTRKRTLCPCCVPVALHPAVKLGLRLEELEGWTFISEQTVRRAGRTKASRKDGRTSAKIRYRNCKIHKDPGGHGLSSASVESLKTSSG